ncbi:MAG: TM0106 family RecB-like putative nuclease [Patescibacteria group bacterium]
MDTPKLTSDHFYKFFQCPHWIWYDIYGDSTRKRQMAPLLETIFKGKMRDAGSMLREHKKFEEIKPELFRDLDEAFLATLELMKQGKNIYHGVLMSSKWVGMPDLLEARPLHQIQGEPEKSEFGDWYYVAYDAQQSLDLRDEFKFPLVFYSLILEKLQGVRPKEAYVIDANNNERSFLVNDFVDQFHLTREQIEKVLNGEKPAPFLKGGCKRTPWYSVCLSDAQGCNDVSLIHRLSQSDQRQLYNIGIKTVQDMADANLDDLRSKLEEWPFDKLVRLNNQAKVLISGEPMILRKPEFPKVKHEVYFDIESDPTRDIDYLLGVLIKNTETEETQYRYFLAKEKSEEQKMWRDFLDFLVTLDDFVIYHYAYYENQVFDRMVVQYGAPTELIHKFRENTIDLHTRFVDSVVLPVYFYTLKDIAYHLGYRWDNPNAGGAESVVWYNEWLDKGDESILKRLLRYNEDDVRATLLVKEWLENQKPSKSKEKESLDE